MLKNKIEATISLLLPEYSKTINLFFNNFYQKYNSTKLYKKLQNKKEINVLFSCSESAKWKCQTLYDLMLKDSHFNPQIVVTIPYCKDYRENEYLQNCKFFKEKGIDFLEGYIPQNNFFVPYEKFKPDIIFYQQPYANYKTQSPLCCSEFALSYYVPYFLPNQISELEYGLDFHLQMDKFYVLDNEIKNRYCSLMINKGKNLVTAGHPTLDYFYLNRHKSFEKKYVIFAPHHSLNDFRTNFSTFLWSGKLILEYAKNHPEINWVFKPHPYLKITLKNYWRENEIENYWNEWAQIAVICENSDYLNLFSESYALITDCGSFLTEYFLTEQPVIHMRRKDSVPFNETVTKISDTYYKAYNEDDLKNLLEQILIEKNDTKKNERKNLLTYFNFPNNYCAENIINDIKKDLKINE